MKSLSILVAVVLVAVAAYSAAPAVAEVDCRRVLQLMRACVPCSSKSSSVSSLPCCPPRGGGGGMPVRNPKPLRACVPCSSKSSSVSSLPCCPPRGGGGGLVRKLKKIAQSPEEKRPAACECLKQLAARKYSQVIHPDVAAQLAKRCA